MQGEPRLRHHGTAPALQVLRGGPPARTGSASSLGARRQSTFSRGGYASQHSERRPSSALRRRRSAADVAGVALSQVLSLRGAKAAAVEKRVDRIDRVSQQARQAETVFVSGNALRDLNGAQQFGSARAFSAAGNFLTSFDSVAALSRLPLLRTLSLQNNPVTQLPYYRAHMLAICPGLRVLDGAEVTAEERRGAGSVLAAEAEALAQLYAGHLLLTRLSHVHRHSSMLLEFRAAIHRELGVAPASVAPPSLRRLLRIGVQRLTDLFPPGQICAALRREVRHEKMSRPDCSWPQAYARVLDAQLQEVSAQLIVLKSLTPAPAHDGALELEPSDCDDLPQIVALWNDAVAAAVPGLEQTVITPAAPASPPPSPTNLSPPRAWRPPASPPGGSPDAPRPRPPVLPVPVRKHSAGSMLGRKMSASLPLTPRAAQEEEGSTAGDTLVSALPPHQDEAALAQHLSDEVELQRVNELLRQRLEEYAAANERNVQAARRYRDEARQHKEREAALRRALAASEDAAEEARRRLGEEEGRVADARSGLVSELEQAMRELAGLKEDNAAMEAALAAAEEARLRDEAEAVELRLRLQEHAEARSHATAEAAAAEAELIRLTADLAWRQRQESEDGSPRMGRLRRRGLLSHHLQLWRLRAWQLRGCRRLRETVERRGHQRRFLRLWRRIARRGRMLRLGSLVYSAAVRATAMRRLRLYRRPQPRRLTPSGGGFGRARYSPSPGPFDEYRSLPGPAPFDRRRSAPSVHPETPRAFGWALTVSDAVFEAPSAGRRCSDGTSVAESRRPPSPQSAEQRHWQTTVAARNYRRRLCRRVVQAWRREARRRACGRELLLRRRLSQWRRAARARRREAAMEHFADRLRDMHTAAAQQRLMRRWCAAAMRRRRLGCLECCFQRSRRQADLRRCLGQWCAGTLRRLLASRSGAAAATSRAAAILDVERDKAQALAKKNVKLTDALSRAAEEIGRLRAQRIAQDGRVAELQRAAEEAASARRAVEARAGALKEHTADRLAECRELREAVSKGDEAVARHEEARTAAVRDAERRIADVSSKIQLTEARRQESETELVDLRRELARAQEASHTTTHTMLHLTGQLRKTVAEGSKTIAELDAEHRVHQAAAAAWEQEIAARAAPDSNSLEEVEQRQLKQVDALRRKIDDTEFTRAAAQADADAQRFDARRLQYELDLALRREGGEGPAAPPVCTGSAGVPEPSRPLSPTSVSAVEPGSWMYAAEDSGGEVEELLRRAKRAREQLDQSKLGRMPGSFGDANVSVNSGAEVKAASRRVSPLRDPSW
eukprot:TRINITY_DN1170_c3_g1_i1.p1 TRINITY_DN1170_c3_g1~~TRINITY_DN1170_c3_g1_i1.p1  ORF type:complete len:1318 (+),score=467.48 TRINITY_DN1170_c3_g1_i1:58-3954(+)